MDRKLQNHLVMTKATYPINKSEERPTFLHLITYNLAFGVECQQIRVPFDIQACYSLGNKSSVVVILRQSGACLRSSLQPGD